MNRLSNMNKEKLIDYIESGKYCDQDIIDLYDDLVQRDEQIRELNNQVWKLEDDIEMHRSNYDSNYWEEKEREWFEDGLED